MAHRYELRALGRQLRAQASEKQNAAEEAGCKLLMQAETLRAAEAAAAEALRLSAGSASTTLPPPHGGNSKAASRCAVQALKGSCSCSLGNNDHIATRAYICALILVHCHPSIARACGSLISDTGPGWRMAADGYILPMVPSPRFCAAVAFAAKHFTDGCA